MLDSPHRRWLPQSPPIDEDRRRSRHAKLFASRNFGVNDGRASSILHASCESRGINRRDPARQGKPIGLLNRARMFEKSVGIFAKLILLRGALGCQCGPEGLLVPTSQRKMTINHGNIVGVPLPNDAEHALKTSAVLTLEISKLS